MVEYGEQIIGIGAQETTVADRVNYEDSAGGSAGRRFPLQPGQM
jgi:hypothetical protein